MKRRMIVFLILVCSLARAEDDKLTLKPYGFVKADLIYALGGTQSFGKNTLIASQTATGEDFNQIGMTAQNTRFGLKGSLKKDDMTVGGRIELDFFDLNWDANTKPRIRLAYASYAPNAMLEMRMGQQWDIFSPNNPATNNVGGNLWNKGNLGFRRPQLQLRLTRDIGSVTPLLHLSAGETTKDGTGGYGADNLSGLPMLQGRLAATFMKKMVIGAYGMYAAYGEDKEYTSSGFGLDFNLPVHTLFAIKGEVNLGANLNNANLFTIAGSTGGKTVTGTDTLYSFVTLAGDTMYETEDIEATDDTDHKSMGIWLCAVSKPLDKLNVIVGFGMDRNTSGDLADGKTEKNQTVYFDLVFPLAPQYTLALEYEMLSTALKGGDTHTAGLIDMEVKVTF